MKLYEVIGDKPASQMDLDWSIAKIKEVKAEIDNLRNNSKYDIERAGTATAKREAKRWHEIFDEATWRMDTAIMFHEKLIPEFNEIKARLNSAMENKDVSALKSLHDELKTLVTKYDLIKLDRRVMHVNLTRLKIERGYPKKMHDTVQYILSIRDKIPAAIKRAGRSDVENERADKTSAAMKRRWSSF